MKKLTPKKRFLIVCLLAVVLIGCGTAEREEPVLEPTATAVPQGDKVNLPVETPTETPADTPTSAPPTAAAAAPSADDVWANRADMPTGRWEHHTCVVDGKIYVIGGAGPIYQALGTVELYDPVSDTWTTKSEMPTARQGLSTSVVNGKIYAIGGGVSPDPLYVNVETLSTVEEYDPATDTWTTKSPMPSERGWHSAGVVDGRIWVFGGSKDSGPSSNQLWTVEVYDPATDTWTQKGDIRRAMGAGSGSVVDGKIYLIGGYGGPQRVDEYDPATDTLTAMARMPTSRVGLSTSVIEGKIYAFGGFAFGVAGYPGGTAVEVYDAATDTWTTAPDMPTGRFGAYSSVVDGKIYVIGGLRGWPATASLSTVEVYDPRD